MIKALRLKIGLCTILGGVSLIGAYASPYALGWTQGESKGMVHWGGAVASVIVGGANEPSLMTGGIMEAALWQQIAIDAPKRKKRELKNSWCEQNISEGEYRVNGEYHGVLQALTQKSSRQITFNNHCKH